VSTQGIKLLCHRKHLFRSDHSRSAD